MTRKHSFRAEHPVHWTPVGDGTDDLRAMSVGKSGKRISKRADVSGLMAEFKKWLAGQAVGNHRATVWLKGPEGTRFAVRVSIRDASLHGMEYGIANDINKLRTYLLDGKGGGEGEFVFSLDIVNITMSDRAKGKGIFPSFLDEVEATVLSAPHPPKIPSPFKKDVSLPIVCVAVESIQNPALAHYLLERRARPGWKYKTMPASFSEATLGASPTLAALRKDFAKHVVQR